MRARIRAAWKIQAEPIETKAAQSCFTNVLEMSTRAALQTKDLHRSHFMFTEQLFLEQNRTMKDRPRAALYARVSTKDKGQDTEVQLAQLRKFCAANHWPIAAEFVD